MKSVRLGCFIVFYMAASFCVSCKPGIRLNTTGVQESGIRGNFRVILFGCNYLNDLETVVFLYKEGDPYTLEPYAPDFKYRIDKQVVVKDAFEKAKQFLNCNASFTHYRMSRITAPDGDTIGYEIRPLYEPLTYGAEDVLYTDYRLNGDKVVITIRLRPSIERMLEDGGAMERE
jgi:hypothetical protein